MLELKQLAHYVAGIGNDPGNSAPGTTKVCFLIDQALWKKKKSASSSSEAGSRRNDDHIPGQGKIHAAIAMETEQTGHTMAFPMKMFQCYRTLAETMMRNGDITGTTTLESIEALGALTEASLYELGGFDEKDIYACRQ